MIDSHCHLDVAAFDRDREDVLARAAALTGILIPAIRPSTWPALRAIDHPLVRIALGIHPQIVPELTPDEELTAETLARAALITKAVAIGETGLDGGTGERERQEELFRLHVQAARLARLPLVVHAFRAHDAVPRILREERADDVGGVMHSYSGGAELVPIYRDLGFAFSFAGPVTYDNARKPLEAVRVIPEELLLVETDAPDQAPASRRGQRSEPAFLPEIIAAVATARGTDPSHIALITTANARRVFRAWTA